MNDFFIKTIKHKKKIFFIFIFILIIISFKQVQFFYNYIKIKYYVEAKEIKLINEEVYKTIINIPNIGINNLSKKEILKTSIWHKGLKKEFEERTIHYLDKKYKENFYYQYIFGDIKKKKIWQHLDQLSYFFLSYPPANHWTKKILNTIAPTVNDIFFYNILSYLKWKKNYELFNYILNKKYVDSFNDIRPIKVINYNDSLDKLKTIIADTFNINKIRIGENYLKCPDFEDNSVRNFYWHLKNLVNRSPFGEGSFFLDVDEIKDNKMIRIFNVFNRSTSKQTPPRGEINYKIRFRRHQSLVNGYYLFSFDYWLKSGQERPQFRGGKRKKMKSFHWLKKDKKKKWTKVLYIINNSKGDVVFFEPLIRMYGTGSMWIDNIFFSKINSEKIQFEENFKLIYY